MSFPKGDSFSESYDYSKVSHQAFVDLWVMYNYSEEFSFDDMVLVLVYRYKELEDVSTTCLGGIFVSKWKHEYAGRTLDWAAKGAMGALQNDLLRAKQGYRK